MPHRIPALCAFWEAAAWAWWPTQAFLQQKQRAYFDHPLAFGVPIRPGATIRIERIKRIPPPEGLA